MRRYLFVNDSGLLFFCAGVVVFIVIFVCVFVFFFFQAEDGIRDLVRSRGLGDVYKRQVCVSSCCVGNDVRSPGSD